MCFLVSIYNKKMSRVLICKFLSYKKNYFNNSLFIWSMLWWTDFIFESTSSCFWSYKAVRFPSEQWGALAYLLFIFIKQSEQAYKVEHRGPVIAQSLLLHLEFSDSLMPSASFVPMRCAAAAGVVRPQRKPKPCFERFSRWVKTQSVRHWGWEFSCESSILQSDESFYKCFRGKINGRICKLFLY